MNAPVSASGRRRRGRGHSVLSRRSAAPHAHGQPQPAGRAGAFNPHLRFAILRVPTAYDMTMPDVPIGPVQRFDPRRQAPPTAGTVGMWLFLAALFMLFASSLLGYVVIRQLAARNNPAATVLELPQPLWLSTALVLGVSVAIAAAQRFFARGLQIPYRRALVGALALAAGFITVQTPALVGLLQQHREVAARFKIHIYGLIFFLILLHALHVVGGMIGLARLTWRAQRGGYDISNPNPLRLVALYWHFLDAVWVVMFATFYLMR